MDSRNAGEREKRNDIVEVVKLLEGLSPIQVEVVRSIIKRFADEQESKLVRDDFLTQASFEYFTMRLAAHHAYSSSVLKKENFEHILGSGLIDHNQNATAAAMQMAEKKACAHRS